MSSPSRGGGGGVRTSSSSTSPAAASSPSASAAGPLQPVALYSSAPASVAARYLHPALLSALFVWRFGALVRDPVAELGGAGLLAPLALLQVAFAVLVVPPAGGGAAEHVAQNNRKPRPGEKKRDGKKLGGGGGGVNVAVATALSLLLTLVPATPLLHVILVLFGAPFLTHVPHTLLASLHLALLGFFPVIYARGASSSAWNAVLGASAPLDACFGGLLGACVGAWLGAIPIPLDWDRDWQAWPVTVVAGMWAGYVLGSVVGGLPGVWGVRLGEGGGSEDAEVNVKEGKGGEVLRKKKR